MPAKQAGRGEAGSAALAEDGEAARGHPQAVHPAHVHPLKEQHEQTSAPRFNPGPGGGSEQGDAGRLPEAPCQVAGLLHHQLGGDDAQVQGQQLVALHHLCLLVLAVVAQQLPGEGGNWGVLQGMAQPAGDGSAKPPPFGSASPRKPLPRTSLQPQDRSPRLRGTQHGYPPPGCPVPARADTGAKQQGWGLPTCSSLLPASRWERSRRRGRAPPSPPACSPGDGDSRGQARTREGRNEGPGVL